MKTRKAPGPDEVVTEMITALDEAGIDLVHRPVSRIYDTGNIPEDMLKSIFVTLRRNLTH